MTDCGPILIVDDDASLRALVRDVLARHGFESTEVESGREALASIKATQPAAVVLDVNLPVISGYTVLKELRELYGDDVPVIVTSGERIESFDRIAGLMLGADDYVVKPFNPDELAARVQRAIERSRTRNGGRAVGAANGSSKGRQLTPREREVLVLLGQGRRQGEIALELVISPKTVATHIQKILSKLEVHSRAEAVAFAHRDGIVE